MKTYILALLFFSFHCAFANAIDKLETQQDVQEFLSKKLPRKWRKIDFFSDVQDNANTTGTTKTFYKIDLDNNGLTDLVINGGKLYAIIDNGNNNYEVYPVEPGSFSSPQYTLQNVIPDPIAKVILQKKMYYDDTGVLPSDTLVFKFNRFIEYNPEPDNFRIKEIKLSTSSCYGTCPVFELKIKADKTVSYHAMAYNKLTGHFTAPIGAAEFLEIEDIIQYINPLLLREKYEVDWTCDQTVTLTIQYDNEKIKLIEDYGAMGTFGLMLLYDKLFALRDSLEWQ